MDDQIEVYDYSIDRFLDLVVKKSKHNSAATVAAKLHSEYFNGYCADIGAQSIVVENRYVDQHFLEDYAAYYVRCFREYDRFCTRIHLFRKRFTRKQFDDYLSGNEDPSEFAEGLQANYLGFVVIKPLPQTVIGRTCLATYPEEGRRNFLVRTYKANLFGTTLTVESLAFQEQDRVVAACATNALWSLFQGTGKRFQHIIPSPVEITRAATKQLPIESRVLPNRGLSAAMMAHAIRHVGLEPDLISVDHEAVLTGTIYGYLRGRIPMILGIELWDTSKPVAVSIGFHAVAVTGYSLGLGAPLPIGETQFRLRASRVDKIYVHDDQVGAFARMVIDGRKIVCRGEKLGQTAALRSISTSWRGGDGEIGSVRAKPSILLVPLYHKIRIPFQTVHDTILSFDSFIEALKNIDRDICRGRLEWDIYLTTNNEFKEHIHTAGLLSGGYVLDVLTAGLPRFLWRATALLDDQPAIDLIFDATDIEHGAFFLRAIEYDTMLSIALRVLTKHERLCEPFQGERSWEIIRWFKKQPVEGLPA